MSLFLNPMGLSNYIMLVKPMYRPMCIQLSIIYIYNYRIYDVNCEKNKCAKKYLLLSYLLLQNGIKNLGFISRRSIISFSIITSSNQHSSYIALILSFFPWFFPFYSPTFNQRCDPSSNLFTFCVLLIETCNFQLNQIRHTNSIARNSTPSLLVLYKTRDLLSLQVFLLKYSNYFKSFQFSKHSK